MQPQQIEQLIADRGYRYAFPPEIEATYRGYRLHFRKRLARALLIPTLVCYNIFLIVDFLLLPQTFWISAALHVFVVSPIVALSLLGLHDGPHATLRSFCVALGPLAMIVQVMAVYALNGTPAAAHYQYLAIFVLIYMNLLFRLEYDEAVIASSFAATIYVGTLIATEASLPVLAIGIMAVGAACYMSLSGNRQMQRDARHGFLRRMQDKFRIEQAQTAAERDALTGLFNRRRLTRVFDDLAGRPSGVQTAALMIDVDHFKRFNDENGHLSGDLCLKRIATLLLTLVRSDEDLVVRFGGEEFLVLMTRTGHLDALRIAERIRGEVEALGILHADGETCVTVSIGVTAGTLGSDIEDDLIAGADAALYDAKQAGRNRVWPRPLAATRKALAKGLEGNEGEGVRNTVENLQPFGDEMADVAVV
ncbi:GGDEF domain-containing protein [Jiella endophytica]|uniref:diguanylate cyclase n=1 Tax=Jiella endophytica TaxID=2558362 RepID=A0A4Y8RRI6_9HYPH|nr:GGDEF domain-containing protein [Jiella endophytica]TFF25307.1 GGDEF domain-containing protein [Jiella endophytica]